MPCPTCIKSIEQGALALYELTYFHADALPDGTDWRQVAAQLRDLTITLKRAAHAARNNHAAEGNPQAAVRDTGEASDREPGDLEQGPYGPC